MRDDKYMDIRRTRGRNHSFNVGVVTTRAVYAGEDKC